MSAKKTFQATITYTVDEEALGATPSLADEREGLKLVTERDQHFTEPGIKVKKISLVEVKE